MASSELQTRRLDAVRAWTSFVEHGDEAEAVVRPEILTSWTRSEAAITPDVTEAPLADESETAAFWHGSPLQTAVERVEAELRRTARTATSSSRSPTRRPASCGRTAAG